MKLVLVNTLAEAIKSKGYTQSQFGEKIGVDQSTVSKLCRQKTFTLPRLQQLLEALNEKDVSKIIKVIEVK